MTTKTQAHYPNLVIVESPAKAKTIEKYLGPGWHVMSSVGHIRGIAKKAVKGVEPIDTAHDFATIYEVDPEKRKVVSELKNAVKNADTVWLATDEDREGEAIAWHLCQVLGLDPATTNRITFHEITKSAIQEAIKHPRHVDMDLVRAQQARQILDRLVGFELSPVVWRKVPGGKSAGRVQSPAVKLLVEREREIQQFENKFSYKVSAIFMGGDQEFKATLARDFPDETAARAFLEQLIGANFTVSDIATTPASRNPLPPFTTSTLQIEANSRLGFSARTTMSAAQTLYQQGKITYMRTDSLNLSAQFIGAAGDYIKTEFGANYHKSRNFKTKSASAQEAHEAIRPTDPRVATVNGSNYEQKLYQLIRNRALASQMAPAQLERTTVKIANDQTADQFDAKGEIVLFDGFLKVYGAHKDELLPKLAAGDELKTKEITACQTFARPPARYTEGSLVKKLEELGIGRPSTYATIINTIQTRGYAEKGDSDGEPRDITEIKLINNQISQDQVQEKTGATKGKLIPTASGLVVSDFLNDYFNDIVDYDFTARVENELDEIARAELEKTQMLRDFYDPFHAKIADSGSIERSAVAGQRELGVDPKSGEPIFARVGRFGPMLQMGSSENKDQKPRFANFPKNARLETITLEQALKMFELPRAVGTTADGQSIIANIGRFGPYIKIGDKFVSIKPLSPFEITEDQASELWVAKQKADAEKNVADFGEIKVLRGRFGPYVTDGTKNAKIPKDIDPTTVDEKQARELLAAAPDRTRARGRRTVKRAKTTTKTKATRAKTKMATKSKTKTAQK